MQHDQTARNHAVIKVIGVGGAGGNAVSRMVGEIAGVEFLAANTDIQALERSGAQVQIQLGAATTRGLGAGARPAMGRQAAEESKDDLKKALSGADMLFIAAGMGGGTGTGAAPFIAQLARDMGILVVAVVTRPFAFEGAVRSRNAEDGITELRQHTDTIVIISNDQLSKTFESKMTFKQALKAADLPLFEACRGITRLVTEVGIINVDFADVRTIMHGGGSSLMGVGSGEGEGRATTAVHQALASPLLEDCEVQGARGVLVHITGGEDLQLSEIHEINEAILARVGAQAEIIFGATEIPSSEGRVQVTIIATGFDHIAREMQRAATVARAETPAPARTEVARPEFAVPATAGPDPRATEIPITPRREPAPVATRIPEPSRAPAGSPSSLWGRLTGDPSNRN